MRRLSRGLLANEMRYQRNWWLARVANALARSEGLAQAESDGMASSSRWQTVICSAWRARASANTGWSHCRAMAVIWRFQRSRPVRISRSMETSRVRRDLPA